MGSFYIYYLGLFHIAFVFFSITQNRMNESTNSTLVYSDSKLRPLAPLISFLVIVIVFGLRQCYVGFGEDFGP